MKRTIIGGTVLLGILWCLSPETAQTQPAAASREVRLIDSIKGPDLYQAYCASCHGADARGAGPMAKSLKVRPADLTRITVRYKGVFPSARVSRIISGEEQLPGHGNREMPVWGPIFSQVEADRDYGRVRIENLAQYLLQLQKP